jgi:hypothetical protein
VKYQVLDSFKAQTSRGEMELQAGQVITLATEKAVKLLNEGKITFAEKAAYKVYSNILQAYLWVVDTDEDMHSLRASQGITEAIYTADEIKELKKLPKEALKVINRVKEVFLMSTIEEITNRVNKVN